MQITETEIDFCIQSVVLNRFIAPVLYHNTADYTQWCRHMLGIKWYHFIPNDEVRCQTNQPLLTEIIQAQHLTLFGHIARMDDNVDTKQILTSSPSVYWKRLPGQPRMTWMKTVQNDLDSHGLSWTDAVDLAQNRPLWRLLATSGTTHS